MQLILYCSIFALSLALNLVQSMWLLPPWESRYADMGMYIEWARRLAAGGPIYTTDWFYPPGNSWFYSLFFRVLPAETALHAIAASLAVMLAASNVLLGLTAQLLFRRWYFGVAAAAASAAYWPFAAMGSFYLAEPLFVFLLILAQFLFVYAMRNRRLALPACAASGILLGLSVIVRTQGLITLAVCCLCAAIFFRRRFACFAVLTAAGAAVLVTTVFVRLHRAEAEGLSFPSAFAANDAFNNYLGQSRRQVISTVDTERGEFYFFANNNSKVEYLFLPPETMLGSLLDRKMFFAATAKLWREDPARQVLFSVQNMIDLFMVRSSWPLGNNKQFDSADLIFQWGACLLLFFPALVTAIRSLTQGSLRLTAMLFAAPICCVAAMALISTGQPRYFLPYHYNLLLLTVPYYARLASTKFGARGRTFFYENLTALLLFALIVACSVTLTRCYAHSIPPRVDGSQRAYTSWETVDPAPNRATPVFVVDLGRDGQAAYVRGPVTGARIEQEGFKVWIPASREVGFAVETADLGVLQLYFPENIFTHIAVYFVDPDSWWRSSTATSGNQLKVAQHLHDGRWISFEITPEEQRLGRKDIVVRKIMGDSAAVSGVLAYRSAK